MIKKNPMYWTPKSLAELADKLESFNGTERAISYMVSMWTFNLCAEMFEQNERQRGGGEQLELEVTR
mgnify:FL=1